VVPAAAPAALTKANSRRAYAMKDFLLQKVRVRGHTFIPTPILASSVVVDLGAHKGEFSRQIFDMFGCTCIAVEANPELQIDLPSGRVIRAAVGDKDGIASLNLSDNPEASTLSNISNEANGKSLTVPVYSLQTLLNKTGVQHIDLLKVDIEGAEVGLLLSTPKEILWCVNQISVEFHDFCDLISLEDVLAVRQRMGELGYYAICFGYHQFKNVDWLFIKRGVVSPLRLFYVKNLIQGIHRLRY
jgi:FkbM family methyltransferase